MTVFKVLSYPHVLLRKVSKDVTRFDDNLRQFLESMCETMYAYQGIGLAAPQVGILKRALVIDVTPYLESETNQEWKGSMALLRAGVPSEIKFPLKIVNPKIIEAQDEGIFPLDGCLSLPGVSKSETKRFFKIVVSAVDEAGVPLEIRASGILSICLQHEMDHLDGVFFIDHLLEPMEKEDILIDISDFESDPKERRKAKKRHAVDARQVGSAPE